MSDRDLKEKIAQLELELHQSQEQVRTVSDLLEKKLNEIYIHYHISRTIGTLHDLQEMLREVIGIIKKTFPLSRISIYLLDEPREFLDLVFHSGLNVESKISLRMGEGTPGRVVENGEHVHIHDLSLFYETFNDFIHMPGEDKREGAFIGIALKVHNATIGMIGMDTEVKYGLTVDDMDFMAILSHQLAAGIEKSRLFDTIQKISQHDGLTGLYNHRMFEEKLSQEINRMGRTRKPLTLVMLDIDHFKKFNDTLGHQCGDAVLKQLAVVITNQTRCNTIDACCRYGGEEFAIIMPEIELHNAVRVAERLRKAVENHDFQFNGKSIGTTVTVSIGVACLPGGEEMGPEELVKKADDALYLSKKNGRNQVSYSPIQT